ncbi:MAG TPA: ferrochelatase [Candidatus Limnocylindrales bacterium]|nr:ferrochelatase [Candidatus Limnocylindrales bacterium]
MSEDRLLGGGRPGALLMTYGSPDSLSREDIGAYLARVRGGRPPEADLVDEFTRRYRVIGGSPLIDITRQQASRLSQALGWPVEVGMRFSEPSIAAGLRALADAGVDEVAAIILSPQHSPMLMGGYQRAIDAARAGMGTNEPRVVVAGAWHLEPALIRALAAGIERALEALAPHERQEVAVLMTAHSLPLRVAQQEPQYLEQLQETAEAVASAGGLGEKDWTFCWQSAGHEPGEWMKPDFADLMPGIAASGGRRVLVVPIQFLADHLETLYDVDVGARDQAIVHGLGFERVAALNASDSLAEALATVARRTLTERPLPVASATG